jgi:hypothetical protein
MAAQISTKGPVFGGLQQPASCTTATSSNLGNALMGSLRGNIVIAANIGNLLLMSHYWSPVARLF